MDGIGRLHVRVYTAQAQIPVAGATVVITRQGGNGKRKLLSVQTTDSSGEIQPVAVIAPAAGESVRPGSVQPFAVCDVWAESPGFAMLLVEGVQAFSGADTLQTMELTPLAEGEDSLTTTDVREIPQQTL